MSEITKSPEEVSSLDCVQFCLQGSLDEVPESIIPIILYQLCCEDGTPLMQESCFIAPYAGDTITRPVEICLEFGHLIKSLNTPLPDCSVTEITKLDDFCKEIVLKHRSNLFNEITCEGAIEPTIISDAVKVVNAYQNFDKEYDFTVPTTLSERPLNSVICKDGCDFLYFWNPTTGSINVSYGVNGLLIGDTAIGNGAWSIPIGADNNFWGGSFNLGDIINIKIGDVEYNLKVDICCCNVKVFSLEPKGGYSPMNFCKTSTRIVTNAIEICEVQDCDEELKDRLVSGGRSMIGNEYYEEFTLTKDLDLNTENECWVKSFFANPNKYLSLKDENGNNCLTKILIASGSFTINELNNTIELSITGYLHKRYAAQC